MKPLVPPASPFVAVYSYLGTYVRGGLCVAPEQQPCGLRFALIVAGDIAHIFRALAQCRLDVGLTSDRLVSVTPTS
jgi:hypothetical protein